jgi:hypothetical protein
MRYIDRDHAVNSYRNAYGRYLRDMHTREEMREFLRHHIDLADLPSDLANLYETSDRTWNRFLDDIIRTSKALR